MSLEYEKFTNNGETVIIKPGEEFSMKELKIRLKLMGIDAKEFQNKSALTKYYDTLIKLDEKKLKIFDKLKHDTEINEFNRNNRNNRDMIQLPINGIKNKEPNIQQSQSNNNVKLKRANKITDDNFNNIDNFPLLFDDSESVKTEKNENKNHKMFRQVVYHTLFGFVTISTALGFLYIYRIYSEEINKNISLILGKISNLNIYWPISVFIFVFLLVITKFIKKTIIPKLVKKLMKNEERNSHELSHEENI